VLCGVYGPRTVTDEFIEQGRINCDVKMTSFATRDRTDLSKEWSLYLKEALESSVMLDKFPKSVVDIFVLVLENDGSALSASITCASLALANAGVELFSFVSSCSTCEVNSELVIDPTLSEEKASNGSITLSMMTPLKEITHMTQTGVFQSKKLTESIEICVDGCAKVHDSMKHALRSK
jgi:exosome complex component MTR3